jgi:hypothetical protein
MMLVFVLIALSRLVFLSLTMLMTSMFAHHKKVAGEHGDEKNKENVVAFYANKRQHKDEP